MGQGDVFTRVCHSVRGGGGGGGVTTPSQYGVCIAIGTIQTLTLP